METKINLCICGKPANIKEMCKTCYSRKYREEHPERQKRDRECSKKYAKEHPDKIKKWRREWQRKNPDKVREHQRRYREKHPEVKIKALNYLKKHEKDIHKKQVCRILKKHAEDLKDDPERLSTEFLQKIIGIKC